MDEKIKQDYKKYYDIIEIIGYGGYGLVYKGKEKKTKELRAIKIIDLDKIIEGLLIFNDANELEKELQLNIDGFIQEFENMKLCSKDNINSVKCYEYFYNNKIFVIIMELCDKNLSQLLAENIKQNKIGFNEEQIWIIMNQLNNSFKIMKNNNIIHRDLKLENILIKYENNKTIFKIADYGSSKKLINLSSYCFSNKGTLLYMAPEILKQEQYNYKCDLWSIGIIIYRLYFGKSPFTGETKEALVNIISKLGNKLINKTNNIELDDLIINLLNKNPSERLDWDKYLNHPFFKYKKKLNLIYMSKKDYSEENIFGHYFVYENKNNIELMINGIKSNLVSTSKLKKGYNIIQMIIKTKITNLEYMFSDCSNLINIDDLKYLDIREITSFKLMFKGCFSLTDIRSLEYWDVSKIANFECMFHTCESLSDINPLKNWNVSNGKNFKGMFYRCTLLSSTDIKSLKETTFLSLSDILLNPFGIGFYIFEKTFSFFSQKIHSSKRNIKLCLSGIKPLENWNVSNGTNFSSMFWGCSLLTDIKPLEKWNVSNGTNFGLMFTACSNLSDIKPLEEWNVSNGVAFNSMFEGCTSLFDIKPLQRWNISNGKYFERMFRGCALDKKQLEFLNIDPNILLN